MPSHSQSADNQPEKQGGLKKMMEEELEDEKVYSGVNLMIPMEVI